MKKRSLILIILFMAVVAGIHGITIATGNDYYLTQLTMASYYSLVVVGLCLIMGYTGQVSLGHAAFFSIGGYTSAVLTTYDFSAYDSTAWAGVLKKLHVFMAKEDLYGGNIITVSPWAAFIAAMILTVFIATLVGYPALRLKGHYLAMATLGFGLIVYKIVLGSQITGSADGISGVPEWVLPGGLAITGKRDLRVENYYFACLLLLFFLVLMSNLAQSRVGRALRAIHDHETAASSIGINTAVYKLKAFVLSAVLASLAGVLLTHFTGSIGPSEASSFKSVRYVALTVAGGMGNPWSAAAVSLALTYCSLRNWFGSFDNAVFGVILIIIISFSSEGLLKIPVVAGRYLYAWFRQHGKERS